MKCKKRILLLALLLFSTVLIGGMNVQAKKKTKPKSLKKAKITLAKSSYTYNGKAKKPAVTVKLGKKKLKKNRKLRVLKKKLRLKKVSPLLQTKGKKAKYKGSKSKTFKIKKASRLLVPDKAAYSAVEGDGSFSIVAKPSKGGGTVTYACATTGVIKVTKAGKVTIVKTFDKTCKTLSKQIRQLRLPLPLRLTKNRYVFSVPMTVLINTAIRRRVHCLRDLLIIKN